MITGWIKIYRKIYENPRSNDPDWIALWVYLLCNATWEPKDVIFKGKRITLQPGQLTTGRLEMALATGINDSKIERIIFLLKSEQQIEQQRQAQEKSQKQTRMIVIGAVVVVLGFVAYKYLYKKK